LLALVLLLALLPGCGLGAGATATPSGTTPPVLALPPQLAGQRVFVADLVAGDLAQLGAKTYHVSRSIHGLGVSGDGRWLYVSDVAGGRLVAYPLSGGALGDPAQSHAVPVGGQPVHMINTADGQRILVTNFSGASVSVVSATSWTVEKTIPTPAQPHGIVLAPDGRLAYVACYGGAAIAVIDTNTLVLARTIALPAGSEPYGITTSPDGRYVYASDNLTGRLFVVDVGNGDRILPALTIGQHPALIARSPDGKTLYVSSGASHSVSVVSLAPDPAHPTLKASVDVTGYPHGIAVTPDGRYVVVATTTGKTLAVIDTQSDKVVATVPGESYPNDVLIAP
jgi:YVTN family beta-propeller protein